METLAEQQNRLASAIRDPSKGQGFDQEQQRRLRIYQELFFNNIDGFLSNGFPVIKSILSESKWTHLVRTFFIQHHSSSPYFLHITKAFIEFLDGQPELLSDYPVFLLQLAHYEWVELDVSARLEMGENIPENGIYLIHSASVVAYDYPVHSIGPDFQPTQSDGQYFYLVYRDAQYAVQFVRINALTAQLLTLIEQQPGLDADSLLNQLAEQFPQFSRDQLMAGLQQTLVELSTQGVVRGI